MNRFYDRMTGWLPEKHHWDRLQPLLVIAIALGSFVWTILLFQMQVSVSRANTAFAHNESYRRYLALDPQGAAAFDAMGEALRGVVSAQSCQFWAETLDPVPDCANLSAEGRDRIRGAAQAGFERRADLRARITRAAALIPVDQAALRWAWNRLAYLDAYVLCARNGQCDRQIAAALLHEEIVPFLNTLCHFQAEGMPSRAISLRLAQFIRDGFGRGRPTYSSDPHQTDRFMCEWLRG